jgi:hypothetical protein
MTGRHAKAIGKTRNPSGCGPQGCAAFHSIATRRREPARQRLASGVGDTQPPDWLESDAAEGVTRVRTNQLPQLRKRQRNKPEPHSLRRLYLFQPGRLLDPAPSMDAIMPVLCNEAVTGKATNSALRHAFSGLWKIAGRGRHLQPLSAPRSCSRRRARCEWDQRAKRARAPCAAGQCAHLRCAHRCRPHCPTRRRAAGRA